MIKDNWAKPITNTATKSFDKMHINKNPKHPSIQLIFHNHFHDFLNLSDVKKVGVRPVVLKEVEKMLSCGTLDAGFEIYECPHCHNMHIICYTCKSRFCSSCGVNRAREQSAKIRQIALHVPHRHVVFTIDERLRLYFRKNYHLLNILFLSASQTIDYVFSKMKGKKYSITPGYILTLHTFGRDLKWNPHIHCLLTEGGITNLGNFIRAPYINYSTLRKGFMKCVLDNMKLALADNPIEFKKFKQLVNQIYKDDENGFYVFAPDIEDKKQKDIDTLIDYVVRYTGRPVMAASRITNYDPDKKEISYYYEDHTTSQRVDVTESVYEFIGKLIKHIPEEQFKMVRYYGAYATCNHKLKKFVRLLRSKLSRFAFEKLGYRRQLITVFGTDPLLCSCGHFMNYVDNYIPQKWRNDIYEFA